MNLLMSGSAFLYYGEELGMKGSGKDENKRAPMYWSEYSADDGMCKGPADMDAEPFLSTEVIVPVLSAKEKSKQLSIPLS